MPNALRPSSLHVDVDTSWYQRKASALRQRVCLATLAGAFLSQQQHTRTHRQISMPSLYACTCVPRPNLGSDKTSESAIAKGLRGTCRLDTASADSLAARQAPLFMLSLPPSAQSSRDSALHPASCSCDLKATRAHHGARDAAAHGALAPLCVRQQHTPEFVTASRVNVCVVQW